jgi:hypothetical protein
MAFDLVLKQGLVLDPSQDLHDIRDIGIQNGTIPKVKRRLDPKHTLNDHQEVLGGYSHENYRGRTKGTSGSDT